MKSFINEITQFDWDYNWKGPVKCDAIETTNAVLSSLVNSKRSFSELLKLCVSYTGDVDTVAALSISIKKGDTHFMEEEYLTE